MSLLDSRPASAAPADLLRKPLIIGASVSAGYGTRSPGDRLSLRYTRAEDIKNLARGGTPGRDHAARLTPELLKDRSIVIAMDYLFWDSTLSSEKESLASLDKLLSLARARKIPVILGDVPELLPGRQRLRTRLNDELRARCKANENCYLLQLDSLHRRVMKDRFLEVRGRKYSFPELVPDGLHLAEFASEYLADLIFAEPLFSQP